MIINAFVLYIGCMMAIGVYYYRQTKNMSDYFLGNRRLGAWVTSLSAEASDMSGWMLMGVPGFAYLAGLNAGWIAVGIAIGTWANWQFVAARLRRYTELAGNALTLPEFLQNRYNDTSNLLRIVPAIFILIFFILYTSSGFVSAGRLFETVFGLDFQLAIILGAGSVVFYTLIGGFLAVSRTDFIHCDFACANLRGNVTWRIRRNCCGNFKFQSVNVRSVFEAGRFANRIYRSHFTFGMGYRIFWTAAHFG